MKDFIEKLIENLDKLITDTYYKSVDGSASAGIENGAYRNVKKIVNELAEEYQKVYEEKLSEEWITGFAIGATDGWIPCSERLPDKSGEYLTFVEYDDDKFIAIDEFSTEGILVEWNCTPNYRVIAWQPLPAAWKGVENGKK